MSKNYKGEEFVHTDGRLLKELNVISKKLESNMRNSGKRFLVSEILAIGKNSFHKLWPELEPNKLDNKHSKNEFKGLYAFATIKRGKIDWQYVGVSQTIKRRFRGHTLRKSKNSATWAYLMGKKKENRIPGIQKTKIYPCYFTFVLIDNNMKLHMAEVYCVNKFKSTWNSFETH